MSIENPTTILVDVSGSFIGTPTNVLHVSSSAVVSNVVSVTGSVVISEPVAISGSVSVIHGTSTIAVTTTVTGSGEAVTLLAANSSRLGAVFVNESAAPSFLKFGSGASKTSYTYRMPIFATVELSPPVYVGIITSVWNAGTGTMRITELT